MVVREVLTRGYVGRDLNEERLSHAASCRESLPGRGNRKGKCPDMRKTQRVQGPVRARSPSVSGTHDISVWSSAYNTLPGSLPPCPAFPAPQLLLSLSQDFQVFFNSQVYPFYISCKIVTWHFLSVRAPCVPPLSCGFCFPSLILRHIIPT